MNWFDNLELHATEDRLVQLADGIAVAIRRRDATWSFSRRLGGTNDDAPLADNPWADGNAWVHLAPRRPWVRLRVAPATPDRPIVVRTRHPVLLAPGAKLVMYTQIPLWIAFAGDSSPEERVFECPSFDMANTWFGSPMVGQLCYTDPSDVEVDATVLKPTPLRAVCPIHVRNASRQPITFRRLVVLADMVRLFRHPDADLSMANALWTSGAKATFQGPESVNLDVGDGPPFENAVAVAGVRRKEDGGILKKSLVLLRQISAY